MTKAGLLICTCFAIFLSSLYGQTAQNSPSRPESFEWDHQIELWDQAFDSYNYIAAERYGRRSLEIVDQLRLDDVKRATSLSSIAEALRFQKKYEQAEPLFRQALAIREKLLPPIHPRTAFSLEGLAATLVGLNRPTEAEPYYLRAIAIWDRASEDDYESCHHGKVLDGLGRIYFRAGDYEKAEPLYHRALSIWTENKQKCTVILGVLNDLAALYWAQGKIERCEQMYEQTIPLLQKELGAERPELVAEQQARLARVYMAEKKPAEAAALYEQLVPVLRRSGASERELVLQSLINETSCLRQLHRDSDLPRVQEQIDAIQGIKSQSIEPRTRWQGLTALVNHTFDTAQRKVLLQQALVEAEKLGPGRELDETLELLAVTGASPDQAEAYMKRAVAASEQAFGKESPQVAHDLENLATALWSVKKENEAEAARRRAIAILEKLPERKAELSLAEQHLADVVRSQQRFAEAESLYLRSVQAAEGSSAPSEWAVSIAVERVATLYKEWGKPEQAVPYYIRAVKLEEAHPNLDPSLLFDLESLSELLRKLNRAEEAKTYDEQRKQIIDQQIAKRVASSPTK